MTTLPLALLEKAEIGTDDLQNNRALVAEVRRLSKVSESQSVLAIIRQWAIICGTISLWWIAATYLGWVKWPLYLVAIIVIATRQHCLLALMHEGTHSRLSVNRKWNDFISDMFCAFPMGVSTDLYRRQHLEHHAHTNTENDPYWIGMQAHEDWHWPKDQIAAMKLFALDFLGLAGHKLVFLFLNWSPARTLLEKQLKLTPGERLRLATWGISLVTLLTVYHQWWNFLLFWVIPALSVFTPMVRMRSVAEHLVLESSHELNKTRHVESNFIERMLVAPMNLNYHIVHHLYPSIPFYNLPKMHEILMRQAAYRDNAHFTPSYWGMRRGVWAEITKTSAH